MNENHENIGKNVFSKEVEVKPHFEFGIFLSKAIIPYIILFFIFIADMADGDLDDGILDTKFYIITFILTVFFSFIVLPILKVKANKTSYLFDKEGVSCKSEFPRLTNLRLKYLDINKVTINQGYLQKKYNIGDIILESNEKKITLSNVGKLTEVKTFINDMIEKLNMKKQN